MVKVISRSILETIRFYADMGDILTSAHMALVFYPVLIDQVKTKENDGPGPAD